MPAKSCPSCDSTQLETDHTLGQVVCAECGTIVERGILVSEVGFTEGGGGRMHMQGTFVSNYSTGIAGLRGKDAGQSSAAVKQAGCDKIQFTARAMGLGTGISGGAIRSFSLAVDQRFNKGRRTDYLVASCLYLQCRLMSEPYMLIDFSERLQVNVYEVAQVYLKLRTSLLLDKTMPEVDPAMYNNHFARRLQFGTQTTQVAADATSLVRRFKADWMTQGRQPGGICGACLIIAGRMSNFLRTPEEVSQVVKCSAYTIRKRLREFARTGMAQKTVKEWRDMSVKELEEIGTEEPPIVRYNRLKKEKAEKARLEMLEDAEENAEDDDQARRDKEEEAIQEAARLAGAAEEEEEEEEDDNMEQLTGAALADDIDAAVEDPLAAQQIRQLERQAFKRKNRVMTKAYLEPDAGLDDFEEAGLDKEEGAEDADADPTQLEAAEDGQPLFKPDTFTEWENKDSTLQHFTDSYFASDPTLALLDPKHAKERISKWLHSGRDPKEVAWECQVVEAAYKRREFIARESRLETLSDLDDDELEEWYVLDERDKQVRTRMWLSENGRWMEKNRIKIEEREAYNKANNIDPNKPKAKRKRNGPGPGPQKPYKNVRDAVEAFASHKKFSSRINYGALASMSGGKFENDDHGLERMDEKDDDPTGVANFDHDKEEENSDDDW